MKLDHAAFEKWETWGKKIHDDLFYKLIKPRQYFRGFNEMAKANAKHIAAHGGGDFFDFVAQGYVSQVAMAIRRHAKDDDTISFMRILKQVSTGGLQSQSQSVGGVFSKKTSAGVRKSRHARGRLFSTFSTRRTSQWEMSRKSVPLGKYCRIRPLVFSLVPR